MTRRTWAGSAGGPIFPDHEFPFGEVRVVHGAICSTGGLEMMATTKPWQPESCDGCGAPFELSGCSYCGRGQEKRR